MFLLPQYMKLHEKIMWLCRLILYCICVHSSSVGLNAFRHTLDHLKPVDIFIQHCINILARIKTAKGKWIFGRFHVC